MHRSTTGTSPRSSTISSRRNDTSLPSATTPLSSTLSLLFTPLNHETDERSSPPTTTAGSSMHAMISAFNCGWKVLPGVGVLLQLASSLATKIVVVVWHSHPNHRQQHPAETPTTATMQKQHHRCANEKEYDDISNHNDDSSHTSATTTTTASLTLQLLSPQRTSKSCLKKQSPMHIRNTQRVLRSTTTATTNLRRRCVQFAVATDTTTSRPESPATEILWTKPRTIAAEKSSSGSPCVFKTTPKQRIEPPPDKENSSNHNHNVSRPRAAATAKVTGLTVDCSISISADDSSRRRSLSTLEIDVDDNGSAKEEYAGNSGGCWLSADELDDSRQRDAWGAEYDSPVQRYLQATDAVYYSRVVEKKFSIHPDNETEEEVSIFMAGVHAGHRALETTFSRHGRQRSKARRSAMSSIVAKSRLLTKQQNLLFEARRKKANYLNTTNTAITNALFGWASATVDFVASNVAPDKCNNTMNHRLRLHSLQLSRHSTQWALFVAQVDATAARMEYDSIPPSLLLQSPMTRKNHDSVASTHLSTSATTTTNGLLHESTGRRRIFWIPPRITRATY